MMFRVMISREREIFLCAFLNFHYEAGDCLLSGDEELVRCAGGDVDELAWAQLLACSAFN